MQQNNLTTYRNQEQIYGIFNLRFQGPKVSNSFDKNIKTTSINKFKVSIKLELLRNYWALELITTTLEKCNLQVYCVP